MSLITIKKGEIALSDTLNSNFTYLDKRADAGTFQKYSMETTYKRGDHVTVIKDGFLTCFQSKQDNNINHPLTDTVWWEEVSISSGGGFNLFDTKLSDRVLEGTEALGWALQGTFVYKVALSGTRPGYPDFYDRCLREKSSAEAHQVDLGGMTITLYRNSNGHEFFDIKDKEIVDRWYEKYGVADFYGIDVSSERILMPRNRYYQQVTDNKALVNTYHKSTIPEMEESAGHSHTRGTMEIVGDLGTTCAGGTSGAFRSNSRYTIGNNGDYVTAGADFKASRTWEGETSVSGAHTHNMKDVEKGDAITPPSALKLLYYCVGNTIQDIGWINIAEQVAGGVKEINDAKDTAIIEVNTTKDGITELGEVAKQGIITQTNESTKQISTSKDQAINDVINSTSGIIDDFNTNAINKQNDFDTNALSLLARYDNNDLERTNAFNKNAEEKQTLVDASADLAQKYANGTIEEYPDGSSKYWADKAKDTVVNNIIDDNVISTDKTYSSSKIEETFGKGSGSGHMVGELVPFPVSTKFTPEGFIKPDGTEFTQGLFPDLWQYYLHPITIGEEQVIILDVCTYEEYANEVNTYGACAKWAVDDVRNTFKVPFIPSGYYLKNGDGTVNKAGLPNIKGEVLYNSSTNVARTARGAFWNNKTSNHTWGGTDRRDDVKGFSVFMDASRSNPIYGASDTVETNAVAVQWFIYVANAQIGQSAIDWSRFETAVAGKANKDLGDTEAKLDDDFMDKMYPDYNAGIDISPYRNASNQFTAPSYGIIIFCGDNSTSTHVNNAIYSHWQGGITPYAGNNFPIYLHKGEKFYYEGTTYKGGLTNAFYPLKGAK